VKKYISPIGILILFFACSTRIVFSQVLGATSNQNYIITKRMLTMEDGLPSRMIIDLLQDGDGFMWFGTASGLCRYDGISFKTYNTQNSPLLNNNITRLALDKNNRLIIQTTAYLGSAYSKNNYQVFDLNSNKFTSNKEFLPHMPFKSEQIKQMCCDELGNIFFLTDKPYSLWQYDNNACFKLLIDTFKLALSNTDLAPVNAFIKSYNNNILINFISKNKFYFIRPGSSPIMFNGNGELYPTFDKNSILFYDEGLNRHFAIDSLGHQSILPKTYSMPMSDKKLIDYKGRTPLFKSQQNNYYLYKDSCWIAVYNALEQKDLAYFGVSNYCADNNGNYWFCTEKGVYQVNIRKQQFEHLFSNTQVEKLNNTPVRNIYVDNNANGSRRILAMVNGMLMGKEKEEHSIKSIQGSTIIKKNELIYVAGNAIITQYNFIDDKTAIHAFTNIGDPWSLADFSDSIILIGGSSGIISYHIHTHVASLVKVLNKHLPPPVNVYKIIKTNTKGWAAVAENGIYFINNQGAIYDCYGNTQKQPDKCLPVTSIFDLYEDKEGVAWLATNGEGLIRLNWSAKHPMAAENIKRFTALEGLPSDILYRIEEDQLNNLWISSYNGLVSFNKKNYTTKTYRTKDGLTNDEFNRISSFKDAQGRIYFGGQNGIDAFDPRKMTAIDKEQDAPFRLVGLSMFSGDKDSIKDMLYAFKTSHKIIMHEGDKFLSVAFSLLDFENRIHGYAFKIEGLDKDWNYINENIVRLSNLPYGNIKLRIKAQLESGMWKEEELIIPIIVIKPYYLEPGFYGILFFLILASFLMIYNWRVNKLSKDNLKLESQVQQRTNSLTEALKDREVLLKEIHHRVKNNLQVITSLLELQKDEIDDALTLAAFNEAQSRIGSILLIHQNLYQNKDLGNIEFKQFLLGLSKQVSNLYKRNNRMLELSLMQNEIFIDIDTAVSLGLIVNELLTNTYKHAFAATNRVKAAIDLVSTEKGNYQLTYYDSGPGLQKIPDFKQSKTLGLHLIGVLSKQLGGEAIYNNEQGSTFIINFKDAAARQKEY
jgi:two-component sensor histidine kinase